jgi:hypothetical protein
MRHHLGHRAIAFAALTAGLTGVAGASNAAAAPVPGAQYTVSFEGTVSEDITQTTSDGTTTVTQEQSGTWTLKSEDPAFLLWLPKVKISNRNLDSNDVNGGTSGTYIDPASLTDKGHDNQGNSWSCTSTEITDSGESPMAATILAGDLFVNTTFQGYTDQPGGRQFHTGVNGASCSGEGSPLTVTYPTDPSNTATKGDVSYGVHFPVSDVGKASFELSAIDTSRVNSDPFWSANGFSSPNFHVTGTYKFKKKCDGMVTFANDYASGKCGSSKRPNTKATIKSVDKKKRKVKITFTGSGGSAPLKFQCKVDKGSYTKCSSPAVFKGLNKGHHTILIRAKDALGQLDKSPAKASFTI